MNEVAQLAAMAAEMTAAGYQVTIDLPGDQLPGDTDGHPALAGLRLDLVGYWEAEVPAEGHPAILIVEVANRRRVPEWKSGLRRLVQFVEDEEAIRRFETISQAVAKRPDIDFQIRFFDVSADQSAARTLEGPIRTKEVMVDRISEAQGLLIKSRGRDELSRALMVTRLWSHWLRIVGHLYPGKDRRELPAADLRTIQKDLSDHKVLTMSPGKYAAIHQSVMAAFEGGDVDVDALLTLQPQVQALLTWAAEHYGIRIELPEAALGSLRDRLEREIGEKVIGPRRQELLTDLFVLTVVQGDSAFAKRVNDFLLAEAREPVISEALKIELMERASTLGTQSLE